MGGGPTPDLLPAWQAGSALGVMLDVSADGPLPDGGSVPPAPSGGPFFWGGNDSW